ncbi:unnamed protein product [Leptosia nina]|uniref:Nudix hydrolase domain-containing protein n=1 Tax=Leptosia nina TaxID=320188 RepID=A0AAV1K4M2_9NEOP
MSFSSRILLTAAARERCIACLRELPEFVHENVTPKQRAAVLVPICVIDDQLHLLYTLRASNLKTHGGQVSFPGGKMDKGEDAVETALRETEEEIGVPRDVIDVWCPMSSLQGRDKEMLITPIVGVINDFEQQTLVPSVHEVQEIFTVPLSALCEPKNHAHLKFENTMLPVYLYGKYKIWGITGFITHFFLQCFLSGNNYQVDFMRKNFTLDELMQSKL